SSDIRAATQPSSTSDRFEGKPDVRSLLRRPCPAEAMPGQGMVSSEEQATDVLDFEKRNPKALFSYPKGKRPPVVTPCSTSIRTHPPKNRSSASFVRAGACTRSYTSDRVQRPSGGSAARTVKTRSASRA